jgi:hypothetical protein
VAIFVVSWCVPDKKNVLKSHQLNTKIAAVQTRLSFEFSICMKPFTLKIATKLQPYRFIKEVLLIPYTRKKGKNILQYHYNNVYKYNGFFKTFYFLTTVS